MSFKHTDILNSFENVRLHRINKNEYIFSKETGADFLRVAIKENGNFHFTLEDYPHGTKKYISDTPYQNIKDFEFDLEKHMGITLRRKGLVKTKN